MPVWERRAARAHHRFPNPSSASRSRGYHEFERVVADAIGKDLGQPEQHWSPARGTHRRHRVRELYESDEAELSPHRGAAGLLALVDRVIAFTHAGIDGSTGTSTSRRKTRLRAARRAEPIGKLR